MGSFQLHCCQNKSCRGRGGDRIRVERQLVFKCKYFQKEKACLQGHYSKGGDFFFWMKRRWSTLVYLWRTQDTGQRQWRGIPDEPMRKAKAKNTQAKWGKSSLACQLQLFPELGPVHLAASQLECGPTTTRSASRELFRNALSQVLPQICLIHTSGGAQWELRL